MEVIGLFDSEYVCTLKDSSIDSSITPPQHMTEKQFKVIKLDSFTSDEYQQQVGASECLKSADALFESSNIVYVCEFKNGYIDRTTLYEILEKMYASAIVVADKLKIDINTFRNSTKFILVYNYQKNNENNNPYLKIISKTALAAHPQMRRFYDYFNRRRNKKVIETYSTFPPLLKLEKNLYNEIIVLPQHELDRFLHEECNL